MYETVTTDREFLSTPSGWRATAAKKAKAVDIPISIHALRVEGDRRYRLRLGPCAMSSIHALRVEGDHA